jgi:hypothetical protein
MKCPKCGCEIDTEDEHKYEPSKDQIADLPPSIKQRFLPYDSCTPAGKPYKAPPRFLQYSDDHLNDWNFTHPIKAEEDGSVWMVRTYSPTFNSKRNCGGYDVIYCRKTK